MERNRCVEAGCNAACCRDVFFTYTYDEKDILRVFPDAGKVSQSEFESINRPGVYYWKYLFGDCVIRIVGICPNLNGVACETYGDKLDDCNIMSIGSDDCVDSRRRQQTEELTPVEVIL